MPTTAIQTETVQYTPPGGTVETITVTVQDSHKGRADGTVAIPAGTAAGVAVALPAGPYKKLVIHNRQNTQNIGLLFNGAVTELFELPPDGEFAQASLELSASPIASVSIKNIGLQASDAEVDWLLFL